MRLRLMDRIISALLALILLCCAAAIAAQLFFDVPVVEKISGIFKKPEILMHKIIIIGAFVLILLLSLYCLSVLFRHRKRNKKFLTQTTEGGELDISLEALRNLVSKCLDQHPEINAEKVILDNEKNSLSVRIIVKVAGGISIPLTVSLLQKQIKQYVTACSGIEVREVKVTVRTSGEDAADAPFAIEAPTAVPRLKASREENTEEIKTEETHFITADQTVNEKETASQAETPVKRKSHIFDAEPIMDDENPEDDRPLHQRIFSQQAEPCYVPEPEQETEQKEMVQEKQAEAAGENPVDCADVSVNTSEQGNDLEKDGEKQ